MEMQLRGSIKEKLEKPTVDTKYSQSVKGDKGMFESLNQRSLSIM